MLGTGIPAPPYEIHSYLAMGLYEAGTIPD